MVWRHFTLYLVLFLIHNFLLAPLLIHQHRRVLYASIVVAILAGFIIYQCNSKPAFPHRGERPMELRQGDHGARHEERPDMPPVERPDMLPEERPEMSPGNRQERLHDGEHGRRPDFHHRRHLPPAIIGERDIISSIILVVMFGMNLGIKLYFKTRKDQKKLTELEKKNLEQQLEYLKYQINPHFFMNTLNNIHALVDIDAEKAKDTILELSKMMRFVLYEGNKQGVPLSREFDFIGHYIQLMRLRYTDKVKITVDLPTESPDKQIPPLMLITFIENAFKHGISYQQESFIDVKVDIDNSQLHFVCRNSKAEKPNEEKGGVGLANVRQRLKLLFDNNFTLKIQNNPEVYNVELTIPLT